MSGENDGENGTLQLLGKDMPCVKSTTHLGIQRSVSGTITMEEIVNNNIQPVTVLRQRVYTGIMA